MESKILKPATLDAMWTPSGRPQLQDGTPSSYGLGFGILTLNGQKYITHRGGQQVRVPTPDSLLQSLSRLPSSPNMKMADRPM